MDSIVNARPYPLWWEAIDRKPTRPALEDAISADVVIVGGGYTGLWTAYYLSQRDPGLEVVVLERDFIGFGASGRNGGWCYPGFGADLTQIEELSDTDTARQWSRELINTVYEVRKIVTEEDIACDFHQGGTVELYRNGGQATRGAHHISEAQRLGWTTDDIRHLTAEEARAMFSASGASGATFMNHTAAIHPAKLAVGLARAAESHGVTIYENTEATAVRRGLVNTTRGSVAARIVLRTTEGYTAEMEQYHRDLVPLYSLMIATEPLPDALWAEIGLADRQTFADYRHMVIYGQRTADGRIAFGGRGAPYDYGSRIRRGAEFSADHHVALHKTLVDLIPQVEDVAVTHRWGGVLGVARDWMPRVMFDGSTGWVGGYVGSGVAATNLAGRTLTDLVAGDDTTLTRFPWVNLPTRQWEPEPLRWTGIMGVQNLMRLADVEEARRNRPSWLAGTLEQLI